MLNQCAPPTFASSFELLPAFIPATATDVHLSSFHITEITLSNVTAAPVTVTITDKQSTPVALYSAVSVPANSVVAQRFEGRWMPGGVTWSAGSASAVVGSMRGHK